jgi:cysteine desulfurase
MTYFDHNATTPMCPPAREAWLRVQDGLWHNASSLYREAAAAREELERCRERLAELTGTDEPERILFTSGATEGCHAFFRGWAERWAAGGEAPVGVMISPYEHPAVREPARRLCQARVAGEAGWEDGAGEAGREIRAWMAANNETGEVFGWERRLETGAGEAGHRRLCDASQWFGKEPAAAFAGARAVVVGCAHKFGGPKGVGFVRLPEPAGAAAGWAGQCGGPQEHGVRAGTEDVAGVAAMVAALEWCEDQMPGEAGPRDAFEHDLGWSVVAGDRPRLWNTSMVVAPRHQNKLWLARLSQRGIPCSTGSACSSGKDGDSHVLAAMGLEPDAMRRVLRFSSGWSTTADDWHELLAALRAVERELDAR